jgi:hypothetical protein
MPYVVPVRAPVPNRERLYPVLELARAEPPISLVLATFWATARNAGANPVGCLLGHYIHKYRPAHLELAPIAFREQVKSMMLASQLFAKYPIREWVHHIPYYHGPDVEAWGLSAVCLYFQIREYDARRLFWPGERSYALEVSASLVAPMLERFLKSEEVINP